MKTHMKLKIIRSQADDIFDLFMTRIHKLTLHPSKKRLFVLLELKVHVLQLHHSGMATYLLQKINE